MMVSNAWEWRLGATGIFDGLHDTIAWLNMAAYTPPQTRNHANSSNGQANNGICTEW